jgi:hypothetical protein
LCSNTTNILFIIIILVVITGTALAVVVGALFISLVLRFNIITNATDICYTHKVKDSNIEVNIYTVQNRCIISCTLVVDTLYSFINIKRGDKLLKVLFPLRILKVNKYLIVLTPLLNFIVRGVYKSLVAGIIIIDYLGTTNNNKARLWFSNYKKVPRYIPDKFQQTGDYYIIH